MASALCFDAYGTLFDTASVRNRLREILDVPDGLVGSVATLWRDKQLDYSYQLAVMDAYRPFDTVTADALKYALDYYGFDPRALDVDAALGAYEELAPFDDVEPAFDRLDDTELRLAVLSNGTPEMLNAVFEYAGLEQVFEAVISADEVATFKPAPEVYERAAERLDVALDECMLVSAHSWDVAGATQSGMDAAWIDRWNDPPDRVGGDPTLTVESLTQLAADLE